MNSPRGRHEPLIVGASRVPGLFNQSPWATRWMLFQHYSGRLDLDATEREDERMRWGRLLQDDILEETAARLHLEVEPHEQYVQVPELGLGAIRDATIRDPDVGAGAVEAKCVDWLIWRDNWSETAAPPHIELQLQAQLMVGDGTTPYGWGVIAALVGGNDLRIYRREPLPKVQEAIKAEVEKFRDEVRRGVEPDVAGLPIEIPALMALYPEVEPEKVIDLSDTPGGLDLAENARLYRWIKDQISANQKVEKQLKAKLLERIGDAARLVLPETEVRVKKTARKGRIVTLPESLRQQLELYRDAARQDANEDLEALIDELLDWSEEVSKPSVSASLKVKDLARRDDDETDSILSGG